MRIIEQMTHKQVRAWIGSNSHLGLDALSQLAMNSSATFAFCKACGTPTNVDATSCSSNTCGSKDVERIYPIGAAW
jgi:hypothetical protein